MLEKIVKYQLFTITMFLCPFLSKQ